MYHKKGLLYITSLLFIFPFYCNAYSYYEPPMNRSTSLTAEFDKSSLPTSLTIWNALSGGQDDTNGQKWGRNTLTCLSTTDTTYGACATTAAWMYPVSTEGRSAVRLAFTLMGGKNQVVLNITPMHSIYFSTGSCRGQSHTNYASLAYGCDGSLAVFNQFTYSIPQSELTKLSSPGTWKATLKQNLKSWSGSGGTTINTWSADIALTVTDLKNQQVYFPEFPYAAPRVRLNLSNTSGLGAPANQYVGGTSLLDMCLYDGKNSASSQINMIFRDEARFTPGRPYGYFSVYLNGAENGDISNRIDYALSILNPTTGKVESVLNGVEITWRDTNARNIQKQVVIPGVPGISLCVPAPLTFTTRTFRLADKNEGMYSGVLTVIYTPSTQYNSSGL
ncbi:TPA: CfaE/CblD family pilus tip adhesin [Serratia marcescens]